MTKKKSWFGAIMCSTTKKDDTIELENKIIKRRSKTTKEKYQEDES